MSAARCHALRRLNPYLGVTQVIEIEAGRALSVDGLNWEIQVRAELPAGWGSLNRGRKESSYCRFAVWSAGEGFARFRTPPQLDRQAADRSADDLIAAIRAVPVPFALTDTVECWLIEAMRRKPLALLASRQPGMPLPDRVSRRWVAALNTGDAVEPVPREQLASLENWIDQHALPACLWIQRDEEGAGTMLDAQGRATDQCFAATDFPELPIDLSECDNTTSAAYVEWLAPRLLMLPLATETRARLEALAARQAVEVARFCRLYPAVCDPLLLNALRVQAQLMATA